MLEGSQQGLVRMGEGLVSERTSLEGLGGGSQQGLARNGRLVSEWTCFGGTVRRVAAGNSQYG
jgi:hypothetical protein